MFMKFLIMDQELRRQPESCSDSLIMGDQGISKQTNLMITVSEILIRLPEFGWPLKNKNTHVITRL